MSLNEVLMLIGLTLFPLVELRGSIPYGILATSIPWPLVVLICAATNWLTAPITYGLLKLGITALTKRWIWLHTKYEWCVKHTQHRLHPYVDKYGFWGLAIFIAIPLPGTGILSGSIAAYALGMHFRSFLISSLIGVLLASAIITAIVLSGSTAFKFLIA